MSVCPVTLTGGPPWGFRLGGGAAEGEPFFKISKVREQILITLCVILRAVTAIGHGVFNE